MRCHMLTDYMLAICRSLAKQAAFVATYHEMLDFIPMLEEDLERVGEEADTLRTLVGIVSLLLLLGLHTDVLSI